MFCVTQIQWLTNYNVKNFTTVLLQGIFCSLLLFCVDHLFQFWFISEDIFSLLRNSLVYLCFKRRRGQTTNSTAPSSPFSRMQQLGGASFVRGVWMDGSRFIIRFSLICFNLATLRWLRWHAIRWWLWCRSGFSNTSTVSNILHRTNPTTRLQRLMRSSAETAVPVASCFW